MRPEKNPILRKIHEVDQSRDELAAEIRRLERALKKPERLMEQPQLVPSSRLAPRLRTTSAPVAAPAAGEEQPDQVPVEPLPDPLTSNRRAPVAGNETFAHLFSSTRFLGQPALRHERRIQRNRALLLLAGVFLLGYIIFKIVFR
jgi:hypothetical protein